MTFGNHDVYLDIPLERGIFCNRTLNMRSIAAIGYDMDYTLVHYNVEAWEGRAYEHIKLRLLAAGWPVEDLVFDTNRVTRGLVIDLKLGNIVKANRFGYIKRATHGLEVLDYRVMREAYSRVLVDLSDRRFIFLNTFFSISAGCMYSQLVDLLDRGALPEVLGYGDLYTRVQDVLDAAHIEGELKAEIMSNPERYVDLDPEMPLTLLDQREAGKKLMVITNSEWEYTHFMLTYSIDPFLPDGMTWRELFHVVVVAARKPAFFSESGPFFKVVDEEKGLLRPWLGQLEKGGIYHGGNAAALEQFLGMSGDQILYVGDHLFADVNVTKSMLRWRTALVLRELEDELHALDASQDRQERIRQLMFQKVALEDDFSLVRLDRQRQIKGYGPKGSEHTAQDLEARMKELRVMLVELDAKIGPLVALEGMDFNPTWGYLMRTGNDKSNLTRQVERYADVYMSRVSNFLRYTPFMFFRAPRGSLPHDPKT